MNALALSLAVAVGLLHAWILILEMFLWTHPAGLRAFRNTPERAQATRVLAANQGLYNGFLAAGLFWGAATVQWPVLLFFLGCVIVAGCYGAWSVNRRIFFIQAVPALLAAAAVLLAMRGAA